MSTKRCYILFYAISFTLCCLTVAFCVALLHIPAPAPSAVQSPAALASAPVSVPEDEEKVVYLIQTIEGEVCVRCGDGNVIHTGLSAAMLPQHDRSALEHGITVESQQALTSLLEDLGA
jgi:hypothetical protein